MENLETADKKLSLLLEPKLKMALEDYVYKQDAQVGTVPFFFLAVLFFAVFRDRGARSFPPVAFQMAGHTNATMRVREIDAHRIPSC